MSIFHIIQVLIMAYWSFLGEHTNNFVLHLFFSSIIDIFYELSKLVYKFNSRFTNQLRKAGLYVFK